MTIAKGEVVLGESVLVAIGTSDKETCCLIDEGHDNLDDDNLATALQVDLISDISCVDWVAVVLAIQSQRRHSSTTVEQISRGGTTSKMSV